MNLYGKATTKAPLLVLALMFIGALAFGQSVVYPVPNTQTAGAVKVYFTSDITPAGIMQVYNALGVRPAPKDAVAVKISTGEPGDTYYLSPKLIGPFVQAVHGTIVECSTSYQGKRSTTALSYKAAKDHGFNAIAPVKIIDEKGYIDLPVSGGKYLKYDRIGSEFTDFTFHVVLSHFKGHIMAGFGGAIKNMSIGYATPAGKALIHSGGKSLKRTRSKPQQVAFLDAMAEAAKAVATKAGKGNIIYISVLNNLSVDCDCDPSPAKPVLNNIGIAASLDPVALDKACVDMVYSAPSKGVKGDNKPLIERIQSRNAYETLVHAAAIGLGSLKYQLVDVGK
jgi:uncharacterized Fe-S center protein